MREIARLLAMTSAMLMAGACVQAVAAPPTTARGILQRTVADQFEHGRSTQAFTLRTATGTRRLARSQPDHLVGRLVRVTGETTSAGLDGSATATSDARTLPVITPGPRTMAVVMVSFPVNRTQRYTVDQVRTRMFNDATDSLNAFYRQQTDGAVSFGGIRDPAGDVFGPWESTAAVSGCDVAGIADATWRLAQSKGVDLSAYDHVVHVTPRHTCAGGTPEGVAEMPGSVIWLNANIDTWVAAHEVGHNLGSSHAGALRCQDDTGLTAALTARCSGLEYADPLSVMGNSPTVRLTDTWHRDQNGELTPDETVLAGASGTYAVTDANNHIATGPRQVLVPRVNAAGTVNGYIAVEARRPVSLYDDFALDAPIATGITLRLVDAPRSTRNSYLIDTTPRTSAWTDAPLQPGATFTDTATGLRIVNTSTGPDVPTFAVTLPAPPDTTAPSVPAGQNFSVSGRTLTVRWDAATDDVGVGRYELERAGSAPLMSTTGLSLTHEIPFTVATADYRVVAVDAAGNRSRGPWTRITPEPDAIAPTAPGAPTATVNGQTVILAWTAATDNDRVAHYEVVRDGVVVTSTFFLQAVDTVAADATRASYRIVAVDATGNRTSSPAVEIALQPTSIVTPAPAPTAPAPTAPAPVTETPLAPAPTTIAPPPTAAPTAPTAPAPPHRATVSVLVPRVVRGRARIGADRRLRVRTVGASRLTVVAGRRVLLTRASSVLTMRLPRSIVRSRAGVVITVRARVRGTTVNQRIRVRAGTLTVLR